MTRPSEVPTVPLQSIASPYRPIRSMFSIKTNGSSSPITVAPLRTPGHGRSTQAQRTFKRGFGAAWLRIIATIFIGLAVSGGTACREESTLPRAETVRSERWGTPTDGLPDQHAFQQVKWVAIDSQGRVAVGDEGDTRIFDRSGTFLFALPRAISVGELCCAIFSGRDLLAWDLSARQMYQFELGERQAILKRAIRSLTLEGMSPQRLAHMGGDTIALFGEIPSEVHGSLTVRCDVVPPGECRTQLSDLRVSPPPLIVRDSARGSVATYYEPYGARHLQVRGQDGQTAEILTVNGETILRGTNGRSQRFVLDLAPPTLTRSEKEFALRMLEGGARASQRSADALPFGIPKRKALVRDADFDAEGRLWYSLSLQSKEYELVSVRDQSGRFRMLSWPKEISLIPSSFRRGSGIGVVHTKGALDRIARLIISDEPL